MNNILKVIKPFYMLKTGDTLELNEDGFFVNTRNEELNESNENNEDIQARYTQTYSISKDYAKLLIEEGYLAPVEEKKEKEKTFVNVFDEISNMLEEYNEELGNIDDDMADEPACLKVEKETVLRNMIKILEHLNSLKK